MSKLEIGTNDLETWCKQNNACLLLEWDYDKNTILPSEIIKGSSQKVWWKCRLGHEWESTVNNRTHGNGCPYCSGRKALTGVNDLKTWCRVNNREDLLGEWDYQKNDIFPNQVLSKSNVKVWWKCSQGHEWLTSIAKRTADSTGCPYCSGHEVWSGYNDFYTWCITNGRNELLNEWHPTKNADLTPNIIAPTTKMKVWWKCSQGHEWESSVGHRTSGGNGCPYCSNHRILVGYNDLQTRMPALALEWNYEKNGGLKPTDIGVNNSSLVWWKCRYGHEWKASTHSRYRSGCGCPKCSAHGTSLPEQGIAFYLEKVCKVEQRMKVAGKEIDIYLPEYKIGIEYDGKRYHTADTTNKEKKKDSKVFRLV